MSRAIAGVMSIVLVLGLLPLPAFAGNGEFNAGMVSSSPSRGLRTQATKKVALYVVTSMKSSYNHGYGTYTTKDAFVYNSKGLLSGNTNAFGAKNNKERRKLLSYRGTTLTTHYGSKLALDKNGRFSKFLDYTFKRNKQGRVSEAVSSSNMRYGFKYDKKGRVSSKTLTLKRELQAWDGSKTASYTSTRNDSSTYSYNKHGDLAKVLKTYRSTYIYEGGKKETGSESEVITFKNAYKKGRLSGRKGVYSTGSKEAYSYFYKKITVPAKYASKVRAQQWSLLNWNLNFEFPATHPVLFGSVSNELAGPDLTR